MRLMVISLKYDNEKPQPYYGLTERFIPDFNCHNGRKINLHLPQGIVSLNKKEWLNSFKVYQCPHDSKLFFMICTKSASPKAAFKTLLNHALSKVESVIERGECLRVAILKELAA